MGTIFKLLTMLTTMAATMLLAFESARRSAFIFWTILGVLKIIVFLVFCALLIVIIYVLLSPQEPRKSNSTD